MKLFFFSLRVRILFLGLLIVVPYLIVSAYEVIARREALRLKSEAEVTGIARLASSQHEKMIEGARQLLLGLSINDGIRSLDPGKAASILSLVHDKFVFYDNIILAGLDGEPIASSTATAGGVNFSDTFWFREAVAKKDFSAGDYKVNGPGINLPICFAYPVLGIDGNVTGIVSASVSVDRFRSLFSQLTGIPGFSIDLVDLGKSPEKAETSYEKINSESFSAASDEGFLAQVKQKTAYGVFYAEKSGGLRKVYAFSSVPVSSGRYVYVLVGMDESTLFADSVESIKRNISYGVAALLLSALGVWLYSGLFIIKHVETLTRAAREISKGNLDVRAAVPYDCGEMGFLAETFDLMTEAVKKRDKDLRDSESSYRLVMELAADGIFTADSSGRFLAANRRGCEMLMYDCAELKELSIIDLIPEEDVLADPLRFDELARGSRVFAERRVVRKDGSLIKIEVSAQTLPDGRILAIVRDVTERRKAEDDLRHNEAILKSIIDNAPALISVTDLNGGLILANRRIEELCPRQVTGKNRESDELSFASGSGCVLETEDLLRHLDGSIHTYLVLRFPVKLEDEDEHFGICSIATDITERKRYENLLEIERSRLKGILEEMNDGVCIISREMYLEYANPALRKIFGSASGKKCHDYFLCSHRPCILCKASEIMDSGKSLSWEWSSSIHQKSFEVFSTPLKNDDGSVSKLTLMHDITARKKTEKALLESEVKYRLLFETACEAIILMDMKSRAIIDINPAASAMYGYDRQTFLTLSENDLMSESQLPLADVCECSLFIPAALHRKNTGAVFPVEVTTGYIKDKDILVVFVRDISERLQMEEKNTALQEQLIQAQKMETVGRLAGGVAHDFNNILVVIMGYSEMLMEEPLAQNRTVLDYVGEIRKAGEKAQNITKQLLAFGRKQALKKETADLGRIILDFLKMLERLIGEDIKVSAETDSGLWPVEADISQIEQILMNLGVNSRDAMPRGGEILIRTFNQHVTAQNRIFYGNLEPGDYVFLEFTDTGTGMDEETAKHAFDPFFTTKEKGKGTGLGLSTVHGVVKQHGGEIFIKTGKNEGSAFTICLPRSEKNYQSKISSQTRAGGKNVGAGTIMIVEDETSLRKLLCDVVARHGYNVMETRSVSDALKLGFEKRGQIDLLVTDVVMPEMNGPEVAEKLLELCPGMKTLFISGYEGEALERHGLPGDVPLLRKPFPMEELVKKIKDLIGS